jgi:deazaflavin-dependent oxidoreductase (nitroreductase family)
VATESHQGLVRKAMEYPGNAEWRRQVFKTPIVLWRLGLGPLVGQIFMILTTTGRTSGLPRRTAVEYHVWHGKTYIYSGWGERSQWYKNLLADPRVTIQTAHGTEHVIARRVTDDAELDDLYGLLQHNAEVRWFVELLVGEHVDRETFLTDRDRFVVLTFDPTSEPTPPPLAVDLWWVWSALGILLAVWRLLRGRTAESS